MRVITGIDGSDRSYHALEFGSHLLSPKSDSVCLYFSPPRFWPINKASAQKGLGEMAQQALADSVFAKARDHLPTDFHQSLETIVGRTKPSDGILAAADQLRSDLIIIGAHSAKRRLPMFLGGSARKIAHASDVPVLLVREEQPAQSEGRFRVLILCDGDGAWRETVPALQNFSWPEAAQATLLHVIETMDEEQVDELSTHAMSSVPNAESLIAEYRTYVANEKLSTSANLQADRESLPSIVRDASVQVVPGHVVETVVKQVREHEFDLVVVGARKLGPIGRLFGSTTEGLLIQCPCSLLIIHQRNKP